MPAQLNLRSIIKGVDTRGTLGASALQILRLLYIYNVSGRGY